MATGPLHPWWSSAVASLPGASSSSSDSSDFSIGLITREDNSKEARIKEAHVETKEELEGGEVREEACRSMVAVR